MALTYWLVPILFRRELIMKGLASWQPYLFGLGMSGVSLFLMGAGTLGVPRRHWDITFSSTGGIVHEFPAAANTMLALNGLSVILAVIGYGVKYKSSKIVNLGILFFIIDIITRYIGFWMDLGGQVGFAVMAIIGGIILIIGGWSIEKWRKGLIQKSKSKSELGFSIH